MRGAEGFPGTGFGLPRVWQRTRDVGRNLWCGVREWCGDSAYERYLRSATGKSRSCRTLTAEEFYLEQLHRRYSRPNRCC